MRIVAREQGKSLCLRTRPNEKIRQGRGFRAFALTVLLEGLVFDDIRNLTGRDFTRLHTGGGGIQNELLSQAADLKRSLVWSEFRLEIDQPSGAGEHMESCVSKSSAAFP